MNTLRLRLLFLLIVSMLQFGCSGTDNADDEPIPTPPSPVTETPIFQDNFDVDGVLTDSANWAEDHIAFDSLVVSGGAASSGLARYEGSSSIETGYIEVSVPANTNYSTGALLMGTLLVFRGSPDFANGFTCNVKTNGAGGLIASLHDLGTAEDLTGSVNLGIPDTNVPAQKIGCEQTSTTLKLFINDVEIMSYTLGNKGNQSNLTSGHIGILSASEDIKLEYFKYYSTKP